MKILYGVCGEGQGHSSRARVVLNHLVKKGHKVKVLAYGKAYDVLKDDFDCMKTFGLHIFFKNGQIDKGKMFWKNIFGFSKNLFLIQPLLFLMMRFKPDVCVSDMEPLVPVMSFNHKVPLISFDNQHIFTNVSLDIPSEFITDFYLAKIYIDRVVAKADSFIITAFSSGKLLKGNTYLVPPVVREEVLKIKPKSGKKILVYISGGDRSKIITLKNIKEEFVVYGFNQNYKENNLEFKTSEHFMKDLTNCKAIIATSGFSLISEALYLKKPYLAVPLTGQFEQYLNAFFIEKEGYGLYCEELTKENVTDFLSNLSTYKNNLNKYNFDNKKLLSTFDKVLSKIKS